MKQLEFNVGECNMPDSEVQLEAPGQSSPDNTLFTTEERKAIIQQAMEEHGWTEEKAKKNMEDVWRSIEGCAESIYTVNGPLAEPTFDNRNALIDAFPETIRDEVFPESKRMDSLQKQVEELKTLVLQNPGLAEALRAFFQRITVGAGGAILTACGETPEERQAREMQQGMVESNRSAGYASTNPPKGDEKFTLWESTTNTGIDAVDWAQSGAYLAGILLILAGIKGKTDGGSRVIDDVLIFSGVGTFSYAALSGFTKLTSEQSMMLAGIVAALVTAIGYKNGRNIS